MAAVPKVFISATSADLGSSRDVVRLAASDMEWLAVEQKHFPPDYRSLRDMLRAKIKSCDAVVVLVGFLYGSEPQRDLRTSRRRSYTQWEYEFALELGKPVFIFFCERDYPFDCDINVEDDDLRQLQEAHRQRIEDSEIKREILRNKIELSEKTRTLELFLGETRERKQRRGCAVQLVITLAVCLIGWAVLSNYTITIERPGAEMLAGDPKATLDAGEVAQPELRTTKPEREKIEPFVIVDEPPAMSVPSPLAPSPATSPDPVVTSPHRPSFPLATVPQPSYKASAPPMTASPGPRRDDNKSLEYRVKRGDTFYSIGRNFGVPLDALRKANNLVDPKKLREGTKLVIPSKPKVDKDPKPTSLEKENEPSFPVGRKSNKPGHVISPFPPNTELDVTGLSSGSLALDPTSGKVFKVP